MYQGPCEDVIPFFVELGFRLPPRKGVADFLQEITSKKDQEVRSNLLLPGLSERMITNAQPLWMYRRLQLNWTDTMIQRSNLCGLFTVVVIYTYFCSI